MQYPANLLRGVSSPKQVDNRVATPELFTFDDKYKASNGQLALSINWNDDGGSILELKNKRTATGALQFQFGVLAIERARLEYLMSSPNVAGQLGYEREPLSDNPYHGNLLLDPATRPIVRKLVASSIAFMATYRNF